MRGEFTRVPVNKRRRRSNRITRRILTRKRSWWRVCSVFPAFSPLDSWRLASITVFKLVLCLARRLSHIFTSKNVTRKTSWSTSIFVNLFFRIYSKLSDLSLFLTRRNTSNLNANSIKRSELEIGTRKHRKPHLSTRLWNHNATSTNNCTSWISSRVWYLQGEAI